MVEPLKLALERGTIRSKTKTHTVGPYKFNCFFRINYNTEVSNPNFNAIEDRILCRLHRLILRSLKCWKNSTALREVGLMFITHFNPFGMS